MNKIKLFALAVAALFTGGAMAASFVPQQTLVIEEDTIVYASYFAAMTSGNVENWAVDQSVGSKTDKNFVAVDEFVESAAGGSKTLTLKGHPINPYNFASTGRTLHMRISSCSAVTVYGVTSSNARGFSVYATPIDEIVDENTTPVLKVQNTFSKGSFKLEVTDLDATKEYVISVRTWMGESSTSDSECYLYAVRFVAGTLPIDVATLKSITLDGEVLEGFDPVIETYTIELPFGSTEVDIPTIVATTTSKNAKAVVNDATTLPGATTIVVTAEDNKTVKTYIINFTVAASASSEKELLNVTINGVPVTIEALVGNLLVSKNADVTALPVAFEVSDLASANFVSGDTHDFTTPLSITVTAQDLSTAVYTLSVTKATKDVLYLTKAATANDKMYEVIANKGFYIESRVNGDNMVFSGYDLVVLHESLDGKAAASGELAAIATADVPVLNTKSYFYLDGRWNWGTASNGNNQNGIKLNTTDYTNTASHPIFAGLSDSITIYNNAVDKNIQPVTSFVSGKEGYVLAKVAGGCAIHELPAANRVGAEGTAKYIMISLFSGQFGDLTADAQTLLSNTVDYLLSSTVWVPAKTPSGISNAEAAEQAQKVMVGGQLMIIKNGVMYNAQGAIVK